MSSMPARQISEAPLSRILEIAQGLISYPSVTGRELHVMEHVDRLLKRMGWRTERWPIPNESRFNVFATPATASPRVVFTTHLDVVPAPERLFMPEVSGGFLRGRGACDAKGVAAVMIQAAEALRAQGRKDIGLLFVVEEETESAGAQAAVPMLRERKIEFIVNGEPTDGKLVAAQKGILAGRILARGRACHSGYPELGVDANAFLIELGHTLRSISYGEHPVLGKATINLGLIQGGSAGNIISPKGELSFWIRAVGPAGPLRDDVGGAIEEVASRFPGIETATTITIESDPVELLALPGFDTTVFCGGSDVAFYVESGARCLMFGPGSLLLAHTDDERIALTELADAFEAYQRIYHAIGQL